MDDWVTSSKTAVKSESADAFIHRWTTSMTAETVSKNSAAVSTSTEPTGVRPEITTENAIRYIQFQPTSTSYKQLVKPFSFIPSSVLESKKLRRKLFQQILPDDSKIEIEWICATMKSYMNICGRKIKSLYDQEQPHCLIVVHDEMTKSVGQFSWKFGGSSNGHNGIKSIVTYRGPSFVRLRIGINRPRSHQHSVVADYVLSRFAAGEETVLYDKVFPEARRELIQFAQHFALSEVQRTQNPK
jgi:peptidyl-tRNA hydrolase